MRRLIEPSHLDLCCLQKPIIIAFQSLLLSPVKELTIRQPYGSCFVVSWRKGINKLDEKKEKKMKEKKQMTLQKQNTNMNPFHICCKCSKPLLNYYPDQRLVFYQTFTVSKSSASMTGQGPALQSFPS